MDEAEVVAGLVAQTEAELAGLRGELATQEGYVAFLRGRLAAQGNIAGRLREALRAAGKPLRLRELVGAAYGPDPPRGAKATIACTAARHPEWFARPAWGFYTLR